MGFSVDNMGAPMSSFQVADPAAAFLTETDGTAVSFWIISITMIAATVFFFAEARTVSDHWKTSLHTGGLVTLVAGVHYMYMREYWVQVKSSPIVYRYIDWSITVPLQMIEFNLILKAAGKPVSATMFWKLLVGTVAMLGFGYAGEAGGTAGDCSEAVATNFNNMRLIVTVGWAIYPLGYFLGVLCKLPGAEGILNVVYNIADLVNKIGFVLSVWSAAKTESDKKAALLA